MKISKYILSALLLFMSVFSHADNISTEFKTTKNLESVWVYTVNPNDSFERIYLKYLNKRADIVALSKYNHHQLKKKLQPGQIINIPVEMLKKILTKAQVLLVYGDVNSMSAARSDLHQVKKGDFLTQGDSLITGKNSLAKLLFADGSNIDIQPNSNLIIQESYKYAGKETFVTNLKLMKGRTEVSANPDHVLGNSLQIQTPSAIAAVRGTQFRAGAEDNIALQETLEGKVAFSANGQEVMIIKGYGSVAEKGKAPLPPIQLPNAPDVSGLAKLIEDNQAEFNLPSQDDVVAWVGQLALDSDFTQILNEQTTQSGKLIFSDLANGRYYLKIRAQDKHGLQSLDAVHAFNIQRRQPEPKPEPEPILNLIEPLDGAVIPLAPTNFSWTPMPAVNRYIIQIARDDNFTDMIFEYDASTSKLMLNQSFGAGEYYWRVASVLNGISLKFSNVRKFTR
jgi:hypothetical protein